MTAVEGSTAMATGDPSGVDMAAEKKKLGIGERAVG